jgi:hypothetical protein
VTKNRPEGHLSDLRARTCQTPAATVAKMGPEVLPILSLGAITFMAQRAAVANKCPEERPGGLEVVFFPPSRD